VVDTVQIKGGISTRTTVVVNKRELIEAGGFTRRVPCICDKDLTKRKIKEIQKSLRDNGREIEEINGINDLALKRELVRFQKEKGLPVGRFNLATLDSLEVSY